MKVLEDEKQRMWSFFEKKYNELRMKELKEGEGRQETMQRANQFVKHVQVGGVGWGLGGVSRTRAAGAGWSVAVALALAAGW